MFIRVAFFKSIFAVLTVLFVFSPLANAAEYKIDPSHTSIGFKIRHLGISNVSGIFGEFEGSFTFDPKKVEASKAEAKIKAGSIDTAIKKRDDHLRSEEFFNTAKFPEISFVSKEIKNVNGKKFTVVGDLTIHGVTKSITLDAEFGGAVKDPWGNERAAFEASTKINRKDFGLTYSKLLETGGLVVGEEVKILLEIEGIKQ